MRMTSDYWITGITLIATAVIVTIGLMIDRHNKKRGRENNDI